MSPPSRIGFENALPDVQNVLNQVRAAVASTPQGELSAVLVRTEAALEAGERGLRKAVLLIRLAELQAREASIAQERVDVTDKVDSIASP